MATDRCNLLAGRVFDGRGQTLSDAGIAADALALADQAGALRAGLVTDLLVVAGDPTIHVRALCDVQAVWLAGRRVGSAEPGIL